MGLLLSPFSILPIVPFADAHGIGKCQQTDNPSPDQRDLKIGHDPPPQAEWLENPIR